MLDSTNLPRHEMYLEKTHPSGVEEWVCPDCGKRFLLEWPPKFKRVILDPGDQYARHSAVKGGIRMGVPQVSEGDGPEFPDELRALLDEAFKDFDFDEPDHNTDYKPSQE